MKTCEWEGAGPRSQIDISGLEAQGFSCSDYVPDIINNPPRRERNPFFFFQKRTCLMMCETGPGVVITELLSDYL